MYGLLQKYFCKCGQVGSRRRIKPGKVLASSLNKTGLAVIKCPGYVRFYLLHFKHCRGNDNAEAPDKTSKDTTTLFFLKYQLRWFREKKKEYAT